MTTAQVVETSVTVSNNSSIQDYVHTDDHTQPTYSFRMHKVNQKMENVPIIYHKDNGLDVFDHSES